MLDTQGIKFIVHVGIGKTGTSSIQYYLNQVADSSDEFLFTGYLFERLQHKQFEWQRVSGTPMFALVPKEQLRRELTSVLQACIDEAKSKGLKTIVWSNEALCDMAWLPSMLQQLWPGELTTICFVREPASYSISAYYQWGIKHKIYAGEVPSYAEFVKKHHFQPSSSAGTMESSVFDFSYSKLRQDRQCSSIILPTAFHQILRKLLQRS